MAKAGVAAPVSVDLKALLRALKLGKLLDTLPERLTLARQQQLPHADFLELVLADEGTRRDTSSATVRARAAAPAPPPPGGRAAPPASTRACAWKTGTPPPRSASTSSCGTNSRRCGSS